MKPPKEQAQASDHDARVSRIVRILISLKGIRQAEAAEAIGMKGPVFSKAMTGKRAWKIGDLTRMAEFFEVSEAIFFEDPDDLLREFAKSRCFALELAGLEAADLPVSERGSLLVTV